jgi:hypothetical protein
LPVSSRTCHVRGVFVQKTGRFCVAPEHRADRVFVVAEYQALVSGCALGGTGPAPNIAVAVVPGVIDSW